MSLRDDVAALAAITRDSAGAGERESARWIAERLTAIGVEDVAIEPFRAPRTFAWTHLLHAAAGVAAAVRGSRALALATIASYELEVSGRAPWSRRLVPHGQGDNVVALLPALGERRRTLVLVAHHDAARTGRLWDPRVAKIGATRRLRRRAMDPTGAPLGLAAAAIATGTRAGRAIGGTLFAAAAALVVDVARSPTVPGANDNASGVAAVLELCARFVAQPLDGIEVLAAFPGAEESGMGGMAAFLEDHPLDPATTFVVGLDTIGSGRPIIATSEATFLPHGYREADVRFVEEAARGAGLATPERWRLGAWTDPILATYRGLPAVSLLSVGDHGHHSDYHVPDDTPDRLDHACVERCVAIAEAVARAL